MRVLHVITSLGPGGAQATLLKLLEAQPSSIDQLIVCLKSNDKYSVYADRLGVQVIYLDVDSLSHGLKGLCRLWHVCKKWNPTLIQTWLYHGDLFGSLVGLICKVPVIWNIRNGTAKRGVSGLKQKVLVFCLARLSFLIPKTIISCSHAAAAYHRQQGYSGQKIRVINNGYVSSCFKVDQRFRYEVRNEWGVTNKKFVIGVIARLDKQKDHVNLLLACKFLQLLGEFEDVLLVLVGSGEPAVTRDIRELCGEMRLCEYIRFLGERDDVPRIMNAVDITVLPSKYGEAFPNVLCESMLCGAPCIATKVGDSELIIGDNGWSVSAEDWYALSKAILDAKKLHKRQGEWARLRLAASASIRSRFSIDKTIEQYREIWDLADKSKEPN